MDNPITIKCPNCGAPMTKKSRLEECNYCMSMIEWYSGPAHIEEQERINKYFQNFLSTNPNVGYSIIYGSSSFSTSQIVFNQSIGNLIRGS